MTSLIKLTKLAAPVLLAGTLAASATTLDFTTAGFESGSIGSNGWTLTGMPDDAIAGDSIDGPATTALLDGVGLAGDFDGVGVGRGPGTGTNPDEVDRAETLTLEFDREVRITAIYFLDLYKEAPIGGGAVTDIEVASVDYAGGTATFDAVREYRTEGGFLNAATKLKGTTFTFYEALTGNDNVGVGDFALAGVVVEPVPLPAGMLLLGTALGGLGIARRRKKA